jgi:hypothetical protein
MASNIDCGDNPMGTTGHDMDDRLNTVEKWWEVARKGKFPFMLHVKEKPYTKLTPTDKAIVYSYFSGGEEWQKRHLVDEKEEKSSLKDFNPAA